MSTTHGTRDRNAQTLDCPVARHPAVFDNGDHRVTKILRQGLGQPLNRQVERYAFEGVPVSLSTIADAVGACCSVSGPLLRLLEAHVMAAERLHGDDSVLQKRTGWRVSMI